MRKVEGERDPTKIQGVANTIAWMARSLAFDGNFLSPFAQSARQNGIEAIGEILLDFLFIHFLLPDKINFFFFLLFLYYLGIYIIKSN